MDRTDALAAAFWAYGSAQSEFGRAFARGMHLHHTDAAAMMEIVRAEDQGEPLTPARLAERVGLTSAGIAVMLNRLEDAGHLDRRRGHADRRKVTLHAATGMRDASQAFFAPVREAIDALGQQRSDAELRMIEEFVRTLQDIVDTRSRIPIG